MTIGFPEHALGDLARDDRLPGGWFAAGNRDERPQPALHVDNALLFQRPIGVLNGIGVDGELFGKLTNRGERVLRLEDADGNGPPHLIRNLPEHGSRVLGVDLER